MSVTNQFYTNVTASPIQFHLNVRSRRVPTRGDYEREWNERRAQWEVAEAYEADRRATELLGRFLTTDQKKYWYFPDMRGKRYFHLTSQSGRKLVIERSYTYNVFELSSDRDYYSFAYCAGPRGVPLDDFILAQLLLLKYDELEFFRVANREDCRILFHRFNPSA